MMCSLLSGARSSGLRAHATCAAMCGTRPANDQMPVIVEQAEQTPVLCTAHQPVHPNHFSSLGTDPAKCLAASACLLEVDGPPNLSHATQPHSGRRKQLPADSLAAHEPLC